MRLRKIVTSTGLATLGLVLLSPSILAENPSNGDPTSLTGNANITYIEDNGVNGPKDPENPENPDIPNPDDIGTENLDGGPLSIDFITDLNFGTQNITTNEGMYPAQAVTFTDGEGTEVTRGNWVQVTDKRAVDGTTGQPAGWTVMAEMTKQFTTASNVVLNGATLTYNNPVVTANSADKDAVPGITATPGNVLGMGLGSQTMASAAAGSGFGTYFVQYGRAEAFGGQAGDVDMSNSIMLTVPSNTPLAQDTYTAEITWTIAEL